MRSQAQSSSIVIVGAGPVGLTLALLLARRRVASTLVDARTVEQARADGRLLALSAGTAQTLGPLIELPSQAVASIDTVVVSSHGQFGRVVIDRRDAGGDRLGLTIRYGDLVAPLAAAADAEPLITVLRPCRVKAMRQTPARVEVDLDDRQSISGALAINAEGLASPPTAEPKQVAIIADVEVEGVEPGTAFERFTRDGPLAFLPLPARTGLPRTVQRMAMVWCMPPPSAERRLALADREFVSELQSAFGTRNGHVRSVDKRGRHKLNEQARSALCEHRVAYLGNAAQTLHPVAGQGLNLGLRDCAVLAGAIAAAGAKGEDPISALSEYERNRRADRAAILTLTRHAPGLFATRFGPIAWGRSLALSALTLIPELRRDFARLLMFGVRL